MALKLKLRNKRSTDVGPKRIETFTDEDEGLDEEGPFDSGEELGVVHPDVQEHMEKAVEKEDIPQITVGSEDDPFLGKPRVSFDDGRFLIVKSDARNWTLHWFKKSWDNIRACWTSGYRPQGYFGSLSSAIMALSRKHTECKLTMAQHLTLKELISEMRVTEKSIQKWAEEIRHTLSTSGTPDE